MGHPPGIVRERLPLLRTPDRPRQLREQPRQDVRDAILPPGRALLVPGRDGSLETSYQAMQSCATAREFGSAMHRALSRDALELIWTAGVVELRSVQERLTLLADTIVPGARPHFSTYDEPRYRTALQLRITGTLAAVGGVLGPWPGCPDDIAVAHVRLFLEPWASAREGRHVPIQSVGASFALVSGGEVNWGRGGRRVVLVSGGEK